MRISDGSSDVCASGLGPVSGVEMFVPLAKLKKSPHNARKVPHGEAAIEALAASIQHKGLIQNLVVEPEVKANGEPTGYYFVRNRRAVRRVGPCGEAAASLGRCQSEAVAGLSRGWPEDRKSTRLTSSHQ